MKEIRKILFPVDLSEVSPKIAPWVLNTLFLNLYSFSWLRWKQVFGANGGSPVGGCLTPFRFWFTKKPGGMSYGKIRRSRPQTPPFDTRSKVSDFQGRKI